MNDTDGIVSDIYNSLVQMRYPKITTATVKHVESILLKGEDRISLLSWLLSQKSKSVATELGRLEGLVLEDKLFEYYSGIGLCNDKQLLLGNCTWQEQLSFLKLLLDFIKYMCTEASSVDRIQKECTGDVLRAHINQDSNAATSNIESNISHSESLRYFDNLRTFVDKHTELVFNYESPKGRCTGESEAQAMEKVEEIDEPDLYLSFERNIKQFIEALSTIESRSVSNARGANDNLHSMDSDIKEIHANFSSLTKLIRAKEEISNADIPKGLSKFTTPLNEVVEDIVSSSKEVSSIYKT